MNIRPLLLYKSFLLTLLLVIALTSPPPHPRTSLHRDDESYNGYLDDDDVAYIGGYLSGDRNGIWFKEIEKKASTGGRRRGVVVIVVVALVQGVTYHFQDVHNKHNHHKWIKLKMDKKVVEEGIYKQAPTRDDAIRVIKFLKTIRYNLIQKNIFIITTPGSTTTSSSLLCKSCLLNPFSYRRLDDNNDDDRGETSSTLSNGMATLPSYIGNIYLKGEINGHPVYVVVARDNKDGDQEKHHHHHHHSISAAVYTIPLNNLSDTSSYHTHRCLVYDTKVKANSPKLSMTWNVYNNDQLEERASSSSSQNSSQGRRIGSISSLLSSPPYPLSHKRTLILYNDGNRGLIQIPKVCISKEGDNQQQQQQQDEEEGEEEDILVALYDMHDTPPKTDMWRYDHHHHNTGPYSHTTIVGNIWMYWVDAFHVKFVTDNGYNCIYTVGNNEKSSSSKDMNIIILNPQCTRPPPLTLHGGVHDDATSSLPLLDHFQSMQSSTTCSTMIKNRVWEIRVMVEDDDNKRKMSSSSSRILSFIPVSRPQRIPIGLYTTTTTTNIEYTATPSSSSSSLSRWSSSSSINVLSSGGAIITIPEERIHLSHAASPFYYTPIFLTKGRIDVLYDPTNLGMIMDYDGITTTTGSSGTYVLRAQNSLSLGESSPYDHLDTIISSMSNSRRRNSSSSIHHLYNEKGEEGGGEEEKDKFESPTNPTTEEPLYASVRVNNNDDDHDNDDQYILPKGHPKDSPPPLPSPRPTILPAVVIEKEGGEEVVLPRKRLGGKDKEKDKRGGGGGGGIFKRGVGVFSKLKKNDDKKKKKSS